MTRLASPCDDDTGTPGRIALLGGNSRGQMHQASNSAYNTLSVANQVYELAHGCFASEIHRSPEPRVEISARSNLHKLNPAGKVFDHLLVTVDVPPLDRQVTFASS
jgi:hypothetical protein